MPHSDTKTVSRNAIALTVRMAISIAVGLYTSRLIIDALGMADYGIYSVVGSVIGMGAFLNTSLAGATSRYILVELARGDTAKLAAIFHTTQRMHLWLGVAVVILGETIGLWFVNTQMNFPTGSGLAVNVLYQLSVASVLVTFTQIPYTSAIIAHERMGIYAKYEIFSAVVKLILVLLIVRSHVDKLILYGVLTFALSILNAAYFRYYCRRNFEETRLTVGFDKVVSRGILRFSGYNLIGNLCTTIKTEGEPILLNIFFGVVANAAMSIAATVTGAVGGMTTTISQAFRPRIMKQYAAGDICAMQRSMQHAIVFTIGALSIVAIPFILEPEHIIMLWLGQVPLYVANFLRLLIACAFLDVVIYINTAALQATGEIRNASLLSGLVSVCCPLVSWLGFRAGWQPWAILVVNIFGLALTIFISWRLIAAQIAGFATMRYALTCMAVMFAAFTLIGIIYVVWINTKSQCLSLG